MIHDLLASHSFIASHGFTCLIQFSCLSVGTSSSSFRPLFWLQVAGVTGLVPLRSKTNGGDKLGQAGTRRDNSFVHARERGSLLVRIMLYEVNLLFAARLTSRLEWGIR